MPPVSHKNAITHFDDDTGQWVHRFRQSSLEDWFTCPERLRRSITGETPRVENDAACVGTALHSVIEDAIDLMMGDEIVVGADDAADMWRDHWADLAVKLDQAGTPIQFVKRDWNKAVTYGTKAAASFADHVLRYLSPFATEVPFGPIPIYEDELRRIEVTGTIDYIDAEMGMVDWKTAGREYLRWERDRWAIQPTVYSLGWTTRVNQGYVNQWTGTDYTGPTDAWRYCVFVDKATIEPQWVTTQRTHQHHAWLVDQCLSIANTLEALPVDDGPWPKNDQHALCSPKWCGSWATCKGAFLGTEVEWVERVTPPPSIVDR